MKKLYFCEKPSQAMDIAKILGIVSRRNGYIEVKGGHKVSWAVGHVLSMVYPHVYNPAWKTWSLSTLPMIPDKWKLEVSPRTKDQFMVLKKLLAESDEVVICTDAGREGELIAREVIYYCNFKGKITRFWTSSLVEKDIIKALESLKTDAETKPLYVAAVMRQRSDWIVGLNGTRCCTVLFNRRDELFSYGRVQTPTLNLVIQRDREISNFKKEAFFKIIATVKTPRGDSFKMLHAPEEKIKTKEEAERRLGLAKNYNGPVKVIKTKESEKPGLAYSLPLLQKDASSKLKFSAKKTLEIAQSLYEKKFITYPRSDSRHLAESQIAEVRDVTKAVGSVYPKAVECLYTQGIETRKSLFDTSQLTDHAGITPTQEAPSGLNKDESALYALIAQKYLQVIAKDHLYNKTAVELNANGVLFKTSGKEVTQEGWRAISVFGE